MTAAKIYRYTHAMKGKLPKIKKLTDATVRAAIVELHDALEAFKNAEFNLVLKQARAAVDRCDHSISA